MRKIAFIPSFFFQTIYILPKSWIASSIHAGLGFHPNEENMLGVILLLLLPKKTTYWQSTTHADYFHKHEIIKKHDEKHITKGLDRGDGHVADQLWSFQHLCFKRQVSIVPLMA